MGDVRHETSGISLQISFIKASQCKILLRLINSLFTAKEAKVSESYQLSISCDVTLSEAEVLS
jgi:hypothetical protein